MVFFDIEWNHGCDHIPLDEILQIGAVRTDPQTGKIADLSDEALRQVCRTVKAFEIAITEPMGMDAAQVTAGGVMTDGFNPDTMESCLVPGLYACGEVLDIDGDCGGYNLQWAWSSGRCAGLNAGKE